YWFDWGTHIPGLTGHSDLDETLFGRLDQREWNRFSYLKSGSYYLDRISDCSPFLNILDLDDSLLKTIQAELLSEKMEDFNSCATAEEAVRHKFGNTALEKVFKPVLDKLIATDPSALSKNILRQFGLTRILAFPPDESELLKKLPYMD